MRIIINLLLHLLVLDDNEDDEKFRYILTHVNHHQNKNLNTIARFVGSDNGEIIA